MKNLILDIIIFIVTLVVIFIILRLILNRINYFQKRKFTNSIVSGLIAVILYFTLNILFFNSITKVSKQRFNETLWKKEISQRHQMIEDLLKSKYLIGKSKDTINNLFGKPKKRIEEKNIYIYELIDRTWSDFKIVELKIYFENNIVIKFEDSLLTEHNQD
tara:strand:+ start:624 stop:1106 length:483 start_codon:yes stop_codon:yes gene_type:complete